MLGTGESSSVTCHVLKNLQNKLSHVVTAIIQISSLPEDRNMYCTPDSTDFLKILGISASMKN
jgi:hypothetical protein